MRYLKQWIRDESASESRYIEPSQDNRFEALIQKKRREWPRRLETRLTRLRTNPRCAQNGAMLAFD